jgi:hypothetical protein
VDEQELRYRANSLGASLAFEFPLWRDSHKWDTDPVVLLAIEAHRGATEENSKNLSVYREEMKKVRKLPIRYALTFPLAMALYSHVHFEIIKILYFWWWIGFLAMPIRWVVRKYKNLKAWPHGEWLFAHYRDLCTQISRASRDRFEQWKESLRQTDLDAFMKVREIEHQMEMEAVAKRQVRALNAIASNTESIARTSAETAANTKIVRDEVDKRRRGL